MNTQEVKSTKGPLLDKAHGYFASAMINLEPKKVFNLCKNQQLLKDLLQDLPLGLHNFLDLTFESSKALGKDAYRVSFENSEGSKIKGTLTLLLKAATGKRGTFLTTEAKFNGLSFLEDGPSTLMNLFVRRMKAMLETGEVPTTKGQPSGREELKTLH